MKKSVTEVKWRAIESTKNGYADVYSSNGIEVCTVFSIAGGINTARKIVSDHNEQLKVKKALSKTPFNNTK